MPYVLGYGPEKVKLIVVGEAPGRQEEKVGRPFVGASGRLLRETLQKYGLHDENDVYYTNVLPINPGHIERYSQFKALYDKYGDVSMPPLWPVLENNPNAVVLAVGRWAACVVFGEMLFGRPIQLNINEWAGAEWNEHAPESLFAMKNPERVCVGVYHPAGILRDPHRTMLPVFRRVVSRACSYARGSTSFRRVKIAPSRSMHWQMPEKGRGLVYMDTEFDPETYEITLLGYCEDSTNGLVFQTTDKMRMRHFFEWCLSQKKTIVCHNIAADARAVKETFDIDILQKDKETNKPLYEDTILLHSVLSPDTNHSLASALFEYYGGLYYWKILASDPDMFATYNAYDVAALYMLHKTLIKVAKSTTHYNVWLGYNTLLHAVPAAMYIERTGMRVSAKERMALEQKLLKEMSDVKEKVNRILTNDIKARRAYIEGAIKHNQELIDAALTKAIERAKSEVTDDCAYSFKVKPKCQLCLQLYNKHILPARQQIATWVKERNKYKQRLKALDSCGGFDPGNDNDIRWYVTDVLHLKTRRRTKTGLIKVDVDSLTQLAPGQEVIQLCWQYRHARKLLSTFVKGIVPDDKGFVHPRIKLHGTATGRPASGTEQDDERLDNTRTFNAFNLPKEVRAQFVPDFDDHVFIAGDYSDLEGRLVALECGDPWLCALYKRGEDIHSWFASKLFGCNPEDARQTMIDVGGRKLSARFIAKRAAHGTRYGLTPDSMAFKLNIPKELTRKFKTKHDQLFPEVSRWHEQISTNVFGKFKRDLHTGRVAMIARPRRYLTTIGGRVRYFMGVANHPDELHRAIAFSPQSNGAFVWHTLLQRICYLDGSDMSLHLKAFPEARLVIGTYDSVLISCPERIADTCKSWVKEQAERPIPQLSRLPGCKYLEPRFPMDVVLSTTYDTDNTRIEENATAAD